MGDADKMLEEQRKELERVRSKRHRGYNTGMIRKVLNIIFLLLAAIGFTLYCVRDYRGVGIIIIVIGMVVKIIEFFVRFML